MKTKLRLGKEAPDCLQPIFAKNPDQKDITALEHCSYACSCGKHYPECTYGWRHKAGTLVIRADQQLWTGRIILTNGAQETFFLLDDSSILLYDGLQIVSKLGKIGTDI